MAGFQFDFACDEIGKELIAGILQVLQKRARKMDVEIRYRYKHGPNSLYSISIDGTMRAIQSFVALIIESEIAIVYAEAYNKPLAITRRRAIVNKLMRKIKEMTAYSAAQIAEVSYLFGGIPNSYFFDYDEKSDIAYPMASFTGMLILYHAGRVGTTPIVEATHTALEALLNNLTQHLKPQGKQKWISFPEKVDEAERLGHVNNGIAQGIKDFNKKRIDAKHNGQELSPQIVNPMIEGMLEAAHTLLRNVK